MTEPTFRCGWRIQRHRDDIQPFLGEIVNVRRGEFRMQIWPEVFDAMTDEEFAECAARAYREFAFEHLQRDLDTLAKQLLGELEQGNGLIVTDVPYDEVKAALYRWDRARRDMQGET